MFLKVCHLAEGLCLLKQPVQMCDGNTCFIFKFIIPSEEVRLQFGVRGFTWCENFPISLGLLLRRWNCFHKDTLWLSLDWFKELSTRLGDLFTLTKLNGVTSPHERKLQPCLLIPIKGIHFWKSGLSKKMNGKVMTSPPLKAFEHRYSLHDY